MMKKIQVGVADDQPIALHGVVKILNQCADIEVSFTAETTKELLELLAVKPVDVLICDYEFEGGLQVGGLTLLGRVKRVSPQTQVLFLSVQSAPHIVWGAVRAGAAGFIDKGRANFSSLVTAIRHAKSRKVYIVSPTGARRIFQVW